MSTSQPTPSNEQRHPNQPHEGTDRWLELEGAKREGNLALRCVSSFQLPDFGTIQSIYPTRHPNQFVVCQTGAWSVIEINEVGEPLMIFTTRCPTSEDCAVISDTAGRSVDAKYETKFFTAQPMHDGRIVTGRIIVKVTKSGETERAVEVTLWDDDSRGGFQIHSAFQARVSTESRLFKMIVLQDDKIGILDTSQFAIWAEDQQKWSPIATAFRATAARSTNEDSYDEELERIDEDDHPQEDGELLDAYSFEKNKILLADDNFLRVLRLEGAHLVEEYRIKSPIFTYGSASLTLCGSDAQTISLSYQGEIDLSGDFLLKVETQELSDLSEWQGACDFQLEFGSTVDYRNGIWLTCSHNSFSIVARDSSGKMVNLVDVQRSNFDFFEHFSRSVYGGVILPDAKILIYDILQNRRVALWKA